MSYEYKQPPTSPMSLQPTRERIATAIPFLEAYRDAHAELQGLQARVKHAEERVHQAVRDLGRAAEKDAALQAWLIHQLYWDQDRVRVSLIAEAFGLRTYDVQQFAKVNVPCERCRNPIGEPSRQQGLMCCRACEIAKNTEEPYA